ncbi:MORN repeat-containing protein 3-like [Paramacrobiotus metropolitanus]|uniref:MORN repeat-containing protein 3-like n=1 Tax=Paramacrobiotus metropolitanus TaxID=2943436 RepID=UPI002446503A|nr:MORN repeat-containing protein 3-like [Paramacrobiotus metropolitanus]
MDKYLKSFAPIDPFERLQLQHPRNKLKQIQRDVANWYKTATVLEQLKPMKHALPRSKTIKAAVKKKVNLAGGSHYIGDFLNGKRHGFGEYMSRKQGILYRGDWKEGIVHGQGKLFKRMPDKSWFLIYIGEFKNGLKEGWGTLRWSNSEYYEGFWVRGKREGRGRHFAPDGSIYEGQWRNDQREGYGTTREGAGNHHFGEYSQNVKNGTGKYYFTRTGKCLRGVWQDDIPVMSDIIQLQRYKSTFPHQYPLPELGLKNPAIVLQNQLNEIQNHLDYISPRLSIGETPTRMSYLSSDRRGTDVIPEEETTIGEESKRNKKGVRYDMLHFLRSLQPEVSDLKDPVMSAQMANLLVAVEYLERSTADSYQAEEQEVKDAASAD